MKAQIAIVFLCASLGAPGVASAQTPSGRAPSGRATGTPKPTAKKASPVAGRSECAVASGLCVTVPASWQRLGDVFDDLGFVVAEPHPGSDPATWPQLTVAAIEVPPQKPASGDAAPASSPVAPSLDALVDLVLTPNGSFTSAETLQRTRLVLNGREAEIVRVRLHDATQSEAIEAVALTQADEGLVYSIALRSAPEDSTRLEPVFQKAIHSWRIKPLPAKPAPQSKPEQDSKKK